VIRPVVTLDFHNTLVECEPWFDLEVRTLISSYLIWLASETGQIYTDAQLLAGDRIYRDIRRGIHAHGHELPADRAIQVVLERLEIDVGRETVERGLRAIMEPTLEHASVAEGADRLVEWLASERVPMVVVSSAVYHQFLLQALDQFDMLRHIEQVVTSASSGFYKSRPEIYWSSLELVGAQTDQAIHLGDSIAFDVHGAGEAGLRTAWFSRGRPIEDGNGYRSPDLIVDALEGAGPALLEALAKPE
jgi:FMN phosphatase YigB (HAD superfamily)